MRLKEVGGTPVVVRFVMDDSDATRAKRTLQNLLERMLQRANGSLLTTPEILGTEAEIIGGVVAMDRLEATVRHLRRRNVEGLVNKPPKRRKVARR